MVCQCRNAFRRQSSRNCGSFFFSDIARTTPSSSPGGKLSDSISVTKPWRYFWPISASTSCDLLDTISSFRCVAPRFDGPSRRRSKRGAAYVQRQVRYAHNRRIESSKLLQRHIFQCLADGGVDALPRAADAAHALDTALARGAAAFGD